MKNIFYHWCPKHMINGIKKEGLTLGKTPYKNDSVVSCVSFLKNRQWITKDKRRTNQRWANSKQRLGYNRHECLIKINIPNSEMHKVKSMQEVVDELSDKMLLGFNDRPSETKDWYCFYGVIPKSWIESIRTFK